MGGFPRQDGRKGIRNHALVVYLVECARHVAEDYRDRGAQLIGFPSCYPSAYGESMLEALATHPNVGAALLISLGCESFNCARLAEAVGNSGRPVQTITIQKAGGTRSSIAAGKAWIEQALAHLEVMPQAAISASDLVVGLLPGEAGAETCRILGRVTDHLSASGGRIILDDPTKGRDLAARANDRTTAAKLKALADRAVRCRTLTASVMPVAAFTPYAAGSCGIEGLLRPAERPRGTGLYLLDNVPEGEPRHGPIDLGPAVTAAELVACGAQLLVAASDDGELAGTAVAPVVKVCADPRKTSDTGEEIDASNEGEVIDAVLGAIDGWRTSAERLGYCDFALVHKSFESALEGHR